MANNVTTGWLTAKLGGKFAPKTYASNVYMNDGTSVETKLGNLSTDGDTTTVSDGYHSPNYTSGVKIADGYNGVNDLYVPVGTSAETVARGNHTHNYITQQQLEDALNNIDFPEVSPDGSIDLTGYATQNWVNAQGFAKNVKIFLHTIPKDLEQLETDVFEAVYEYTTSELKDYFEYEGAKVLVVREYDTIHDYYTHHVVHTEFFIGFNEPNEVRVYKLSWDYNLNHYYINVKANVEGLWECTYVQFRKYLLKNQLGASLETYDTIQDYVTEKIAEAQLSGGDVDLTTYALKTDLADYVKTENLPTNVGAFTNDKGYITSTTLQDYARQDWVTEKINEAKLEGGDESIDLSIYALKSDIPSLDGYAKTSDVPSLIPAEYITETELNNKGYLTQHQSLEAYAKKSDLNGYATEQWVENKNYLTQHQDLSSYAKKTYVTDAISNSGHATTAELNDGLAKKANSYHEHIMGHITDAPDFTEFSKVGHKHQEYIIFSDLDAAANAAEGHKYSMNLWHRKGYVFTETTTNIKSTKLTEDIRIVDAYLEPNQYITVFETLEVTSQNKFKLSNNVRQFVLTRVIDYSEDPYVTVTVDDSKQTDPITISELLESLRNSAKDGCYIALNVNKSAASVGVNSTLEVLNTTKIYKLEGSKECFSEDIQNEPITVPNSELLHYNDYFELRGTSGYVYKQELEIIEGALNEEYKDLDDFIYSSSSTAYEPGDNGHGLIYTYIGRPEDLLPRAPQIKTVSYTGTSSTTASIVLTFKPEFLRIISTSDNTADGGYEYTLYPKLGTGIVRKYKGANNVIATASSYTGVTTKQNKDGSYTISGLPSSNGVVYSCVAFGGI